MNLRLLVMSVFFSQLSNSFCADVPGCPAPAYSDGMVDIARWQDAAPFAESFVVYRPTTNYFNTHFKMTKVFGDPEGCFSYGYVSASPAHRPEMDLYGRRGLSSEIGYEMSYLEDKKFAPFVNAGPPRNIFLIDSELSKEPWHGHLRMRKVNRDEIRTILMIIQSGEGEFREAVPESKIVTCIEEFNRRDADERKRSSLLQKMVSWRRRN